MYLVRHGERIDKVDSFWKNTAKNPSDPPLTKYGRYQGKRTGKLLQSFQCPNEKFIVISNPWKRCIQTAIEIAKMLKTKVNIHSGLTYKEPDEIIKFPKIKGRFIGQILENKIGYDERKRYIKLMNDLKKKYPKKTIILVTHGEIIQTILNKNVETNYACIVKLNTPKDILFGPTTFHWENQLK